jgi:hypothetical protein
MLVKAIGESGRSAAVLCQIGALLNDCLRCNFNLLLNSIPRAGCGQGHLDMSSAQTQIAGRVARRTRRLLVGAAALILLTGSLSVTTFGGSDLANAAIQRAKSFLEIIHQRSPGRRTQAQLAQTKHKRIAQLHQRALPKVRMPPAIPPLGALPPALIDIVAPPAPIRMANIALPPIPLLQQGTPPGGPFIPPPGLIVPPSTPETPPPIVTPPQAAVPEPGTWATLLLGFGLVGWRLRRRANQGRVAAT